MHISIYLLYTALHWHANIPGPVCSSLFAPFPLTSSALPTSFPLGEAYLVTTQPWFACGFLQFLCTPALHRSAAGGHREEEKELSRVLFNLRCKDLGRNSSNLPFNPASLSQLAEIPNGITLVKALHCKVKNGKGNSLSTCLHRDVLSSALSVELAVLHLFLKGW